MVWRRGLSIAAPYSCHPRPPSCVSIATARGREGRKRKRVGAALAVPLDGSLALPCPALGDHRDGRIERPPQHGGAQRGRGGSGGGGGGGPGAASPRPVRGSGGRGGRRDAEGARRLGRPPGAAMLAVPLRPFCAFLGGLGLLCLAFVAAWCQHWRGGFAWDGSARMFNWHPVLMVAGMVVLYGAAALVYRLPPAWRGPKLPWKVLHSALALTAFSLTVVGLVAVFGFHNASKTPNMYSLHSWLGLATVLLFSCQWLAGFSAFLLPYSPPWLRALYKPVHVFFGSTILMLSVASCVSGINEKLFFSLKNGTAPAPYNRLPPEAVFANTLGLLIVLFGVLVLCALAKPDWKRPEDNSTDTRQPLLGTER